MQNHIFLWTLVDLWSIISDLGWFYHTLFFQQNEGSKGSLKTGSKISNPFLVINVEKSNKCSEHCQVKTLQLDSIH